MNILINFLINFFIIAINLQVFKFTSNYWLLFEAMVVHHDPMGVGVSISSPLELGLRVRLDSQVSGLTSWGLLPIEMRTGRSSIWNLAKLRY
jgi:hypothetical protein